MDRSSLVEKVMCMRKGQMLENIVLVSVLVVALLGLWFIFAGGSILGRAGESGVRQVWIDVGEEEEVDGITVSVESADRNSVEFSVNGVASGPNYGVAYVFESAEVKPVAYSGTRDSVQFKIKLLPPAEVPVPVVSGQKALQVSLTSSGFSPASVKLNSGGKVAFYNPNWFGIKGVRIVYDGEVMAEFSVPSGKSYEFTFSKQGNYGVSYSMGETGFKMGITVGVPSSETSPVVGAVGQTQAAVCQVAEGHLVCQVGPAGQTQAAVCQVIADGQISCQVGSAGQTKAAVCQEVSPGHIACKDVLDGQTKAAVCQVAEGHLVCQVGSAEQKALRVSLTSSGFSPDAVKLDPGGKVAFYNPNVFGLKGVKIVYDGEVIAEFSVPSGKSYEFTFSKQGNYGVSYSMGETGFKMGITVGVSISEPASVVSESEEIKSVVLGPGGSAYFELEEKAVSVAVSKLAAGKLIPEKVLVFGLSGGMLKISLGESATADGYLIQVSKYNLEAKTVTISIKKA